MRMCGLREARACVHMLARATTRQHKGGAVGQDLNDRPACIQFAYARTHARQSRVFYLCARTGVIWAGRVMVLCVCAYCPVENGFENGESRPVAVS